MFTQINYHTPSKTSSQTTGDKQEKRRLDRKIGDNQIERREKKERGEEIGKQPEVCNRMGRTNFDVNDVKRMR